MKTAWLVVVLCVPLSVWSQSDPMGPHDVDGKGCILCHTPVRDYRSAQGDIAPPLLFNALRAQYVGGLPTLTRERPIFHTYLCLTCHDGSIAQIGMVGHRFGALTSTTPLGAEFSRIDSGHPTHIPYLPNSGCAVASATCNPDHWPSRINPDGVISWTADRFKTQAKPAYERRVRFYPSNEAGGAAMVECSTCHNPHSYQSVPYKLNDKVEIRPTQAFLRAWYEKQGKNRDSVSMFCRSCHYAQAGDSFNTTE